MATVPGSPDPVSMIHPAFRPTQADFLQAAAIMHDQGKFRVAGDVVPYSTFRDYYRERTYQQMQNDPNFLAKRATKGILGTVLEKGEGNVLPITTQDK